MAAAVLDAPVAVIGDELDGNDDECSAADELDVRRGEQPCRKERADDAHEDGAEAADDDGLAAHLMRQVLAGQGDEDGVIAGEQQVEQQDARERCEPFRREHPRKEIFQSIHSPKMIPDSYRLSL